MFNKKNRNGFTLAEVMISAVIFTISVAGLFSVLSATRNTSDATERQVQAAHLGRQLLEGLRAKVDQRSWPQATWYLNCNGVLNNWPTTFPNDYPDNPFVQNYILQDTDVMYTCTPQGNGSRLVTLEITWNEP